MDEDAEVEEEAADSVLFSCFLETVFVCVLGADPEEPFVPFFCSFFLPTCLTTQTVSSSDSSLESISSCLAVL
ncbi:hypothetical protein AGMMS50296_5130 [Alphaproteobacteria bacterium]|nr:hypothetical protein AGMMS50296_5130 [Alphaproteobacteria bacterium]